jgi:hypothetical protein
MNKKSSSNRSSKKHKKEIKRKTKRKELRLLKEDFKRKMHAIETAISLFPEKCSHCNEIFSGTDHDLDNWNLDVSKSEIILTCENCANGN